MFKFDLDVQRSYACALGLLGLTIELLFWAFTGHDTPQFLTGAFVTLSVGPVVTGTLQRYEQEKKKNGNGRKEE